MNVFACLRMHESELVFVLHTLGCVWPKKARPDNPPLVYAHRIFGFPLQFYFFLVRGERWRLTGRGGQQALCADYNHLQRDTLYLHVGSGLKITFT